MATNATMQGVLQRRRIIERPRLIALLEESGTRVKTLVAPAGYGKTTLADQWIAHDERPGAWFRARRSSTDVAALALGIARSCTAIVPDCDARLREHLRALPAPAENVEVLSEILGEDLATWPASAWLVIDEYEHIAGADAAERFVEALIDASTIQLLVASRCRPSWTTDRSVIYGDVFELDRRDLAMDSEEGAKVLAQRSARSTSGLLAMANGWPAVIGLASVTPAEIKAGQVPDSLYGFFAEEIFGALEPDVRAGLLALTVASTLDRELTVQLLGAELADRVCATALDTGVMVERGGQLELHPLARSFLEERGEQLRGDRTSDVAERCLAYYRDRRDWEAAFDVVVRQGLNEQLESLLLDALDELLDTARLSTIETWCVLASQSGITSPPFALARAEVALRLGRFTEAQTSAEAAADESTLAFRALAVAGRAAHLDSREEEALDFYRRAATAAETEKDSRAAAWGQLGCLVDLESPEATAALERLRATVIRSNPSEVVRCEAGRLGYQLKLGAIDLTEADRACELLVFVPDPLVRAGFQSMYGCALVLAARYDDALETAESLIELASRYRIDFALPYGLCAVATALAGRRRWQSANVHIDQALQAAREGHNSYGEHICLAAKIRILAQEGRHEAALTIRVPELPGSLPSGRAEALASRALVLASLSRLSEAHELITGLRGSSAAIEPTVLTFAVEAVVALKGRDPAASEHVAALAAAALDAGAPDLLVTAYRSTPELLGLLLRSPHGAEIAQVVSRAGDEDLANAIGQPLGLEDPRSRLSPRELDVLECLQQRLTNRQIAAALFIAESTVKVHVHRIFDKLGVRSRNAIAVQALLQRSDHATSAMAECEAEVDS